MYVMSVMRVSFVKSCFLFYIISCFYILNNNVIFADDSSCSQCLFGCCCGEEYESSKGENKNIIEEKKKLNKKINELKDKKKPIIIGLTNIGNTCYMNAALQCLSNTDELTEFFLYKYIPKNDNNKIVVNAYYNLLLNLWDIEKSNSYYSPDSFKEVLSKENTSFAGIAANDSKDLIEFLIETFHEELNEANNSTDNNNNTIQEDDQTNEQITLNNFIESFKKRNNSPMLDLFYGINKTKSKCHRCGKIKYNFQAYRFLDFSLEAVNTFCFNNGKRPLLNADGTNHDVNLYECFDYYQKLEIFTGHNQMLCNFCNNICDSVHVITLYSTPNYFIIYLNRGKHAVYECKVNFPEQLDLSNYVQCKNGNTVYDLYAVICHLGPSSMDGHFVAYCKNMIDNKWYLYNDAIVSPCYKKQQYYDGLPYILFYKKIKKTKIF